MRLDTTLPLAGFAAGSRVLAGYFLVFGLYSTRLLHLLKPDYLNKIDLLL